jgi:hypothetical protein
MRANCSVTRRSATVPCRAPDDAWASLSLAKANTWMTMTPMKEREILLTMSEASPRSVSPSGSAWHPSRSSQVIDIGAEV